MDAKTSKSDFFHSLLGKDQALSLELVKGGLEVPKGKPTDRQLEEAENAECSEGI